MSFRTKRSGAVFGPARAYGGSDPSSFSGLVGYWDARDLPNGAMTTWPARAGSLGSLTGTGSVIASGGFAAIAQPRLISSSTMSSVSSMAPSTPKAFFFVGKAYILGSSIRALSLICVAAPADTEATRNGMWWYNYSGNVLKIQGTSTNTAAGISQLSINTRYLIVVNHWNGTSGTAYTWGETGSSTAISARTWDGSTAKLCVGTSQAGNANETLDGEVSACGAYDKNLSDDEIIGLRGWANRDFGVVN